MGARRPSRSSRTVAQPAKGVLLIGHILAAVAYFIVATG
jgi:hypothetical protein